MGFGQIDKARAVVPKLGDQFAGERLDGRFVGGIVSGDIEQDVRGLRRKQLVTGSILFHLGVLAIFGGHFVGLLPPSR